MKVVKSNEGVQMDPFGTIVGVHWGSPDIISGLVSVSGSCGECNGRSVTVTINGYTLPNESHDDVMTTEAHMNTTDIVQWLTDRGITVGTSVSISVHVTGTSREDGEHEPPLGDNVDGIWQGFISWNLGPENSGTIADNFETASSGVSHTIDLSHTISLLPPPESS